MQNELLYQSPPACTHFECGGVALRGNVLIQINTVGCRPRKVVYFWLNTAFVDPNLEVVPKRTIDSLRTDKKHRKYPQGFQVHLQFTGTPLGLTAAAGSAAAGSANGAVSGGPRSTSRASSSKDAAASFGRASGSGLTASGVGRRSRGSTGSVGTAKRGASRAVARAPKHAAAAGNLHD